jgi:hypothetical protein
MHVLGRKTRIALLGVMVVANGYTTASAWSSARASIGTGSAAAMVHPTASPHPTAIPFGICTIVATHRLLTAPVLPQRPSRHARAGKGSGTVSARVPRAVFVRVEGSDLVVTTNTGATPQGSDTYYYVRDGHAGLAPPRIVAAVRTACRTR